MKYFFGYYFAHGDLCCVKWDGDFPKTANTKAQVEIPEVEFKWELCNLVKKYPLRKLVMG